MLQHSKTFKTQDKFLEAIINGDISPVVYYRKDGGSPILYTQEFVDKLEKRIEELEKEKKKLLLGGRK